MVMGMNQAFERFIANPHTFSASAGNVSTSRVRVEGEDNEWTSHPAILSYQTPIAVWVSEGRIAVNEHRYSASTTKQQSYLSSRLYEAGYRRTGEAWEASYYPKGISPKQSFGWTIYSNAPDAQEVGRYVDPRYERPKLSRRERRRTERPLPFAPTS